MAVDHTCLTKIDLPFIVPLCSDLTPEDPLLTLHCHPTNGAWRQIDVMRAKDLAADRVCDEMFLRCQSHDCKHSQQCKCMKVSAVESYDVAVSTSVP